MAESGTAAPSSGRFGFGGFTSFLSTVASKVKTVVEEEQQNLKRILSTDESQLERQKEQEASKPKLLPPWLDFSLPDKRQEEEVRNQIMNLTKAKRNFLNAPPDDANFIFDYDKSLPVALSALSADPNLSNARFYLVPKYVKEPRFWRNYFYRVHIIKEAYGLNNTTPAVPATPQSQPAAAPSATAPLSASPSTELASSTDEKKEEAARSEEPLIHTEAPDDEFISDHFSEEMTLRALQNELGQLGVDSDGVASELTEGWEDEMQKELEGKHKDTLDITDAWEEEMKRELAEHS